ncbi:peptidoglycan/LPS O-acetylase OafA/YrhL [Variovorax boronicumulans]|uniref:acyltransferase family protein n=1 Tax=Variovorax boronicumulans TaxID=436515 RepID=UPI00278A10F5|nr:acyltransferase family protein [Variovorax boronicumulans]MDP9913472.1 peptidoglycan/LPS O-acetylase OafA/YrhL [Variovorax boronicumulans]
MTTTSSPTSLSEHAHLVHPKYRPDIDGLRAVAVLSVLGYHAFPQWIKGGFIGVDIFFVISGFLITTIILGSLQGDGFSYREFYARRVKRIFPALALVLLATMAFGWFALLPHEWEQLGKHVAAGAGFVSNFAFWSEAGYFDNAAETKPLLHLWSLAIEEQFYIFWPVLLGLAWKRKWRMLTVLGTVAAMSFLLNVTTIHSHRTAAFYSPLSRFWELMIGGMLAYARLHRPPPKAGWSRHAQSIAGLVLIVLGLCYIRGGKAFPGFWAILPSVGAFFCIAAGPTGVLNRYVLASKPMVWVGLISYPLYLWHWPLLAYARILEGKLPSDGIRALMLVASFVLAWLTYRFVERYTRRSENPTVTAGLVAVMIGFVVLGLLATTRYYVGRHSDPYFNKTAAAAKDWAYPDGLSPIKVDGEVLQQIGQGKRRVLFFGDSHIEQYGPRAVELSKIAPNTLDSLSFTTWGACPPVPNVVDEQNNLCAERRDGGMRLAMSDKFDAVVFGGCWNCYFSVTRKPTAEDAAADRYYYFDGKNKHRFMGGNGAELALSTLETVMTTLSKHKQVYLLLDNPVGAGFGPEEFVKGGRLGSMTVGRMSSTAPWASEQKALHERMRQMAQRSGAVVIDPIPTLCEKDQCTRADADATPIYKDAGHLRAEYVRKHATYMDPAMTTPVPAR